jgi:hypothetical protein
MKSWKACIRTWEGNDLNGENKEKEKSSAEKEKESNLLTQEDIDRLLAEQEAYLNSTPNFYKEDEING